MKVICPVCDTIQPAIGPYKAVARHYVGGEECPGSLVNYRRTKHCRRQTRRLGATANKEMNRLRGRPAFELNLERILEEHRPLSVLCRESGEEWLGVAK